MSIRRHIVQHLKLKISNYLLFEIKVDKSCCLHLQTPIQSIILHSSESLVCLAFRPFTCVLYGSCVSPSYVTPLCAA